MLALVHVIRRPGESPVGFAFDAWLGAAAEGARAVGAQHIVGILVVAALNLAIGEERADAVRIDVVDLEVIVDIPAFGRNCATAHADAAYGRLVPHRPGDLVGAVDGLFHQAVAAKPDEVVPVANLP